MNVVKSGMGIMLSVMFLAGCSIGGTNPDKASGALKQLGKDETAGIKIMYYNKDALFQQYGNLFMAKYPNVDVDVVSTQSIFGPGLDMKAGFEKLVDEEKPDVLFFPTADLFEQWAMNGKLFALDDVIKQDKFDIENLLTPVTELIKAKGNGKLYGLTPTYTSQALYYNKDLFNQYGVPLPKNQMTWQEVTELAKRFPTDGQGDQRIYGYASNYTMNGGKDVGFYYMNAMGVTQGLTFVDPDTMKVSIQTEGWKQALQQTVDALKSGAFYSDKNTASPGLSQPSSYQDYLKRNLFVTGKVAMSLDYSYLIDTIRMAKENLKDITPVNWDIVTVPVDPKNPNVSNGVNVGSLFAVRADSDNRRAAWEFIKYINSADMARIAAKSSGNGLLTRTAYAKERDGRSLDPFYMLKPSENSLYKGAEKVPQGFFDPFSQLAAQEVQQVIDGKKSADEALKTMQEKGQEILIKAKQEQDEKEKIEAQKNKS